MPLLVMCGRRAERARKGAYFKGFCIVAIDWPVEVRRARHGQNLAVVYGWSGRVKSRHRRGTAGGRDIDRNRAIFEGGVTTGVTKWGYTPKKVGLQIWVMGMQIADVRKRGIFKNEIKITWVECEATYPDILRFTIIIQRVVNGLANKFGSIGEGSP